jgi:hypothetical protein
MFVGEDRNFGASYVDESIDLDGKVWINCIFDRCNLHRDSLETLILQSVYIDCEFKGTGWGWFNKGGA